MFSDLNRFVAKTSKSLDILYDKRDELSIVTLEMCELVDVFNGTVDKDAVSLPVRSPKLFSLAAIYDANKELLRPVTGREHYSRDELSRSLSITGRQWRRSCLTGARSREVI